MMSYVNNDVEGAKFSPFSSPNHTPNGSHAEDLGTLHEDDVMFPLVSASVSALRTSNKIREITEGLERKRAGEANKGGKEVISLSIGDPTKFGNLQPSEKATQAVVEAVLSGKANGYAPSTGLETSRKAVAEKFSEPKDDVLLSSRDIILTSGCSHAIQMCVTALADPTKGHNVLIPQPGFSLYKTICDHVGVEVREYPLMPEHDWDVNLEALNDLIDDKTAAVMINNPSNPCGSVYTREHLTKLLQICEIRRVPIIADEIYHGFAFSGSKCLTLASINRHVPILAVGGLSKQYLVPGWRLGWILIHDVDEALAEVRNGLERLATLIVGPNSIVQAALPKILTEVDDTWMSDIVSTLESNASFVYNTLQKIPGLEPVRPRGAMFMMVDVRKISTDCVSFALRMFEEQNLVILPGVVFGAPGFIRITFSAPIPILREACNRIAEFCATST